MSNLEAYRSQWAFVTGAGDGVGRALALGFAGCGVNVAVTDILEDTAHKVADEVRARGVEARAMGVDASVRDELVAASDTLAGEGILPAIVWANAGVGTGSRLLAASPQTIEWAISVNIMSVIWTAQAFAARLIDKSGPRHFGVTASSASLVDVKGPLTLYPATKQATAAIAEALAVELGEHGVGVTILCPGLVNTNIWDAARARPARFGGPKRMPDQVGDLWRKAPGPDVLVAPVIRVMAAGGGRCIVDVAGDLREKMDERHAGIVGAFQEWR